MVRRSEAKEAVPRLSSSYKEELAWLYSLQRFGIKLGLETAHRLIAALNLDLSGARVIHVAGTNGKGSVCAMSESVARAANYRTGLFTSPHLISFRERIRVDGEMISENDVASGLTRIRSLVAEWDGPPTFFEIATALALQHFAAARVDVIILETGLGGRLDSTNAVTSSVSVITPIALDHQQWLGNTLQEIAGEKAGIIKRQTPVISAPQLPEAGRVIQARARECDAPLQVIRENYEKSPIGLRGSHQKQNAALAVAALHAAKLELDKSAIARGLASVEWPARFQCWDERTVIDGAHNPGAARVLAQTWKEVFGEQRATLILAVLNDKDIEGIIKALASIANEVLFPSIRSERALPPEALAEALSTITPKLHHFITPSVEDALKVARTKSDPILLTGSLHFAGEALAHLRGKLAAFEECAQ